MNGKMMWFNEAKGTGLILTEEDERLYVDRDGFVEEAPVGRCSNFPVHFTISERDGMRIAVDTSMVTVLAHNRARRRSSARASR